MDLKRVFVENLRKIRRERGISQIKLAELCGTSLNYIGEIEIGRRFPSLELITKIGQALEIEPFCFFIDDFYETRNDIDKIIHLLTKLPEDIRLDVIHRISAPSV